MPQELRSGSVTHTFKLTKPLKILASKILALDVSRTFKVTQTAGTHSPASLQFTLHNIKVTKVIKPIMGFDCSIFSNFLKIFFNF